ncbi:MAG: hypothetical protein EZS28_012717 [Streblomastix strix]|uniref:Uncharacterized protein n=1 Tax=Streblomastix strix TaxID=222440 RepID=A0A5J4WA46_9EUKA|nr:MAG: hypothetical protein EZS28_012717 [Streblomastix strix]
MYPKQIQNKAQNQIQAKMKMMMKITHKVKVTAVVAVLLAQAVLLRILIMIKQILHIDEDENDDGISEKGFFISGLLTTVIILLVLIAYGIVQEVLFLLKRVPIEMIIGEQPNVDLNGGFPDRIHLDPEELELYGQRVKMLFVILIPTIFMSVIANISWVGQSILRTWGLRHRGKRILERDVYTDWLISELKVKK